ncbi:uncharacterized protein TNCV_3900931 [Trichonephila clavipes]|nr:uncharacterized protein TNCV_3900931 [Trichonephila clavipes]
MNTFVVNDLKNKNRSKSVDDNFHEFLASIARVYPPTEHDEMQAAPPHSYTVIICPLNKSRFITKHNPLPIFNIPHESGKHNCRRSCRCSGVKGSARKGRLDLRFASARYLEIVCGTIAKPTSARIVERVTVGSTSAYRTILRSSLLVVFLVAPDPVFRAWVPSRVRCFQQFLTAHSERSTWLATRRVDQPAVFISMIRPLSNSLNCEKCLLAVFPGMFRLPKSSYNRRVIVTFTNLRIFAGLYSTLFLIVAPPRRV